MATSPTSERRARLIREMAQDLNKTRQSLPRVPNSPDITTSDLSIEEESSQAYRENSRSLPSFRLNNQADTRNSVRSAADYIIDSSAIGRAFPDMTGSGSSVDDGSSISIELGRGLRDGARRLSEDGDSQDFTAKSGQYKIDLSKLPTRRSHSNVGRSSLREVQNTEELRSSPPTTKATAYGTSGSSRQSSAEHQRRLPPKAAVEDASDHTNSSAGHQSTQNLTVRSSRFGRGSVRADPAIPKSFTTAKNLLQSQFESTTRANSSYKLSKPFADNPTITTTNGGTAQSFMLPNMPNMSELVSGVYDDGTPVFSRTTTGRFKQGPKHSAVQSLPVPQDEEAIMMSLRLLQDKVQMLERSKAEAEVTMRELQKRNQALEDEKKAWKRSSKLESRYGHSSGSEMGDEGTAGHRISIMERSRMQSNIHNLQNELDGANRRASIAEANAVDVTAERDSAIAQLGVAFVTQEELKVDNENLKAENLKLRMEVKKYRAAIEAYLQKAESEKTETKNKVTEETPTPGDTRSVDCQVLDVETPKRFGTARQVERDLTVQQEEPSMQVQQDEPSVQVQKRRKRRVIVEEYTATSDFNGFDDESVQRIREASIQLSRAAPRTDTMHRPASRTASIKSTKPAQSFEPTEPVEITQETTKEMTRASRVSFLHEHDVTILRKMLEKEHLQKKGRIPTTSNDKPILNEPTDHLDITRLTARTSRSQTLPRKSSLKDVTGRQSARAETTTHTEIDEEEQIVLDENTFETQRRYGNDHTLPAEKPSKTRKSIQEDITSAFILPDITMNVRQSRPDQGEADAATDMSTGIKDAETKIEHESQNCTVCTRLQGRCVHNEDSKAEQVKIPTPVLASERIKDLALDGDDHTTRPSEPPQQALARTIKCLEDEFAHLGIQLSTLQMQYCELDPSLRKRKRKSLGATIDALRAAMDAKGDQVYALYDVLEGQTGDSAATNPKELNDTLKSVLDEDAADASVNIETLGMPTGIMFKRGAKTSTADVTPAKERAKPARFDRRVSNRMDEFLSDISEKTENIDTLANSRPGSRGHLESSPVAAKSAADAKGFPWDESYSNEDNSEDISSWQGFEDTLDLTRQSQKSNTSSKRKGATATLDL